MMEPVILANSKFSIGLLKVLCKATTGNVLFSPLSISSALGPIVLGAKNNTADQMLKGLRFGKMRIMYHYLFEEIYKEGEYKNLEPNHKMKRSLQLVNRLFGDKTVNFYDDYLDHCEEWCFASLRSVDFKNNPEAAREKINSWVASETDNKIMELLDQGDVSKDTSLALISSMHFRRNWLNAFKKGNGAAMFKTDTLPLGTIPHRQYQLPTEAQILEIPYENNHLSMLTILPKTIDGLPKLVDSITYEKIMEWTEPDNMIPTEVNVEMPSFKLQEKYDLEKALTALGITDLFSDKCDLSGMAPGPLKLSKVVHKCVVEVDEKGTDAEGGGGGVVKTLQSNKITESFKVKSPFLFFIRHNSTKSILFWGRVTPPPPVI
ncbi:serpin B4-like [Onychostoma macrolepis]|uniref:serpin B4-like n=1 Tax=Onychostoma macrolepis TaxID=369639 RepID=UPI00272BE5AA|nr:serpin B4-like [Onychostoma macrolepis]XP_058605993.1 serpin B4-like [Onychostoma macrolepis]XP_058605996.1 serpin B4-like [Onychostoma macrolepis]XP_058605997.1 serpin B4-like [Onychostoma macrolepis]